jgi:hypothetical protein
MPVREDFACKIQAIEESIYPKAGLEVADQLLSIYPKTIFLDVILREIPDGTH